MATIYEEIHGLAPRIEVQNRKDVLEKYAHNKGVSERETTKYFSMLWEAFAWDLALQPPCLNGTHTF